MRYIGDFNNNLFKNGKYILNEKRSFTSQGSVHTMINRYKGFCQIHSLKQLIRCPTRITCNISTLIDHILTSFTEKIFQSEISDQQLIFCTRKVKRVKCHKHNNVLLRSLKHYTVNLFVEGLRKVNFLNYERFSNIDVAYTDFLNKLIKVINEIAPSKERRIKNNNQDWFDRQVADLIHVREKLFLDFKKSKFHIDEEICKKNRNQVQNLIEKRSEISMKLTWSKK